MDDLTTTDACTLPTAERPLRLAEFGALFAQTLHSVEHSGDTVRLQLRGSTDLLDRVRDLAERETACCSFFRFEIEGTDDDVQLQISVPIERHQMLAALVGVAEVASS